MSTGSEPTSSEVDGWEIRRVQRIHEYHACEEVQRQAWNFDTDLDVIPLTQLVAAQKAGGLVLGAFDSEDRLRGFCYGFLGRDDDGRLLHYSHMTAVDPRLRAAGLGARLKWAQRAAVLEQGIDLMIWTFDPLESLNAYFNFSKLGVVAARYLEDLYGTTSSELHRGSPTDRFLAEWRLRSEPVRRRLQGKAGAAAEALARDPQALPVVLAAVEHGTPSGPGEPELGRDDDRLACEIPSAIQEVKRADPEAALAWRLATRAVFSHYLSRGWLVRECVRTREHRPRTLYLLEREATAG